MKEFLRCNFNDVRNQHKEIWLVSKSGERLLLKSRIISAMSLFLLRINLRYLKSVGRASQERDLTAIRSFCGPSCSGEQRKRPAHLTAASSRFSIEPEVDEVWREMVQCWGRHLDGVHIKRSLRRERKHFSNCKWNSSGRGHTQGWVFILPACFSIWYKPLYSARTCHPHLLPQVRACCRHAVDIVFLV